MRWTIVMRAPQSEAQGRESALAELCRLYWYPLYIFVRRRGCSPEAARDLTQRFLLHLLEHRALSRVDRLIGKFRSFLLVSFQNHLSDAFDRARRLKRGGDKEFVQLDAEDAEKLLLYTLSLGAGEIYLSATPMDSVAPPQMLLRCVDNPPGWGIVSKLMRAMEEHRIRSLERPIVINGFASDGSDSWVVA